MTNALSADQRIKLAIGENHVQIEVLKDEVAARDQLITQLRAENAETHASLQAATDELARRAEQIAELSKSIIGS